MRRAAISRILAVYFLVNWAAVLLRIDRFPLTWVPMYSTHTPSETISVRITDDERMRRGFLATQRSGATRYVSRNDLNVPELHFWRIYYERAFGNSPAKYTKGNAHLDRFNRWIRGLEEEEPRFSAEWDWLLLRSLNATLGYEPSDAEFIIRVQAEYEERHYRRDDLSVSWQTIERASPAWKESWVRRWK